MLRARLIRALAVAMPIAIAVLALGVGEAAAAFHPDEIEMARAIRAGDEFWRGDPQNHCLGRNGGTVDATFPARHSTAAGYSRDGVCGTIHVLGSRVEGYARWQFCTLVVHEYGHTIDHVHVEGASIMNARPITLGIHPKECDYPDPHLTSAGEGLVAWPSSGARWR